MKEKKHLKVGFFSLRTSGLPDFERAWLDTIFVTLLPSFKCPSIRLQRLLILTKLLAQNVDQSLATKSQPSFSLKILTKLRLQNLGQTSASKFQLNLKFKILNNLQLQNRDQNSGSKSLPNLSFKISTKLRQHVPQHQGCTSCG